MADWDGDERRKAGNDTRLLIEVHDDVKYLRKSFESHLVQDEKNFTKQEKDIQFLQKIVWSIGGMGVLVTFLANMFHH